MDKPITARLRSKVLHDDRDDQPLIVFLYGKHVNLFGPVAFAASDAIELKDSPKTRSTMPCRLALSGFDRCSDFVEECAPLIHSCIGMGVYPDGHRQSPPVDFWLNTMLRRHEVP